MAPVKSWKNCDCFPSVYDLREGVFSSCYCRHGCEWISKNRHYLLNKDVFADYKFIEAAEQENAEDYFGTMLHVQDPIDPLFVNASSQEESIEPIIEEPMAYVETLPIPSVPAKQTDYSPRDVEVSNVNFGSPPAAPIQISRSENVQTPIVMSNSTNFEFHIPQISPGAKKHRNYEKEVGKPKAAYKIALDENAKVPKQTKPKLSTKEPQPVNQLMRI